MASLGLLLFLDIIRKKVFTINNFDGGDYYVNLYQRIYDEFLFSLSIFGADPKLRGLILKSSINRCEDVLETAKRLQISYIGVVGRLNKRTKLLLHRKYSELYIGSEVKV